MGQRPNLPEEFRSEARIAFAFLVETEGFAEPEDHDLGLRVLPRRPGSAPLLPSGTT
ncbi:hypothetical protein [Streptomyces adonidis]|uniref:hypothetical protein n=1 Tax=Streptomyces adonidis TaxID=3231367 RepID=UPI0034DB1F6B